MKLANSGQLAGAQLVARLLGAQPSLAHAQPPALLADAARYPEPAVRQRRAGIW